MANQPTTMHFALDVGKLSNHTGEENVFIIYTDNKDDATNGYVATHTGPTAKSAIGDDTECVYLGSMNAKDITKAPLVISGTQALDIVQSAKDNAPKAEDRLAFMQDSLKALATQQLQTANGLNL